MNIDIKPLLDNIKSQLVTGVYGQIANAEQVGAEYAADAEKRLLNLAEGALSEQLSYPFVVRRLAEEQTNLVDLALSLASGAIADGEGLAKNVITELEKLLREQITKL